MKSTQSPPQKSIIGSSTSAVVSSETIKALSIHGVQPQAHVEVRRKINLLSPSPTYFSLHGIQKPK